MPTAAEYLQLAQAAYDTAGAPTGWVRLRKSDPNPKGYQGAAFKKLVTGEIVIAHRGTEPLSGDGDWVANYQMGLNQLPDQYKYAKQFYEQVRAANDGVAISITGHSSGGSVGQLQAAETGLSAVTFDPYGAKDLIPALNTRYGLSLDPNATYDNITNHQTALDGVSRLPGSNQIGQMQTHLAPSEMYAAAAVIAVAALTKLNPGAFALAYLGVRLGWSHSINRFEEIFPSPSSAMLSSEDSVADSIRDLSDHVNTIEQAITSETDPILIELQNDLQQLSGTVEQTYKDAVNTTSTAIEQLADLLSTLEKQAVNSFLDFMLDLENAINEIQQTVNDLYTSARNFFWRDPLALDLDGDGIETVGASSTLLFDHDGDGTKSGTGWVQSDDGLLVLDRNGNGVVDNGSELFGVDYVKANGQKALDGFDALRDLDTNGDSRFDASDTQFGKVRAWRDLNQDGVSQVDELLTLTTLNIASIDLVPTVITVDVGGGNQQTASATYSRTDGTTGTMANLNFVDNPFYREFGDSIALTEQAKALPEMRGSGAVRDLREAVSQSGALATALAGYAAQTTRAGQLGQIDSLVHAWADSSDMKTSVQEAAEQGYQLIYLAPGQSASSYEPYLAYGIAGSGSGSFDLSVFSDAELQLLAELKAQQEAITQLIGTLERFNGVTFVDVAPGSVTTGQGIVFAVGSSSGGTSSSGATLVAGVPRAYVSLASRHIDFLNRSFEALKDSVYGGVIIQTRLDSYLDTIAISLGSIDVGFDFAALNATLDTAKQANASNALTDLIELNRYAGALLYSLGWDGLARLRTWVEDASANAELQTVLADLGVMLVSGSLVSGWKPDAIFGQAGSDNFSGGDGNDILDGGAGNDALYGQAGNDTLNGGAGNDDLIGGAGSDVYLLGRGSGEDTISNYDASTGKTDAIQFAADVTPADVVVGSRYNNDLVLKITGTTDKLTVSRYFDTDAAGNYKVEEIRFADGSVWRVPTVKALAIAGNDSDQGIWGYTSADTINAAGGNDTLLGFMGDDTLDGGDGNDTLFGGDGNDVLDGGAGNDWLQGEAGNDTYLWGRGSGQDTISNYDAGTNRVDVLQVKAGTTAGEVTVSRSGNDVNLGIIGTADTLSLYGVLQNDGANSSILNQIQFSDGTSWDIDALKTMLLTGNDSNQGIWGYASADTINAAGGNDTLLGFTGDDTLDGGDGNDTLFGGDGNDVLDGGAGNDWLQGEAGNDTYLWGRGSGQDTISNYDASADNTDVAQFLSGIATDQIWFRHLGNDLEVSIIGTSDMATISNWYSGTQYHVEQFKTADGKTLLDSQVENLVSAMASFAPPAAGQTTLPTAYQADLNPVIAANWQ